MKAIETRKERDTARERPLYPMETSMKEIMIVANVMARFELFLHNFISL